MKRKGIMAALLAVILIAGGLYLAVPKGEPQDICAADVEKHRQALTALICEHQGAYVDERHDGYGQLDALLRQELTAVDLRNPERAVFHFSTFLPETSMQVINCPEDRYVIDDANVVTAQSGEVRVEGLGVNGEGYILCRRICEGWFYVESYLPT